MKFAEEEKNRVFFFFAKEQVIKEKIKGTIEDLKFKKIQKKRKNDRKNSKNISRTFFGFVVSIVDSVHFWLVPWSDLYFSRSIGPFLGSPQ